MSLLSLENRYPILFRCKKMTRKLLIFGNGLGMALDPSHFSLERALKDVWNNADFLTSEHKTLIEYCYKHDGPPQGEHELETLYQAITHCQGLSDIGDTESEHWLTSCGQSFPEITSKYFHAVATNLHLYDKELPDDFLNSLTDFIKCSKSHVATLNYDKLLYSPFIGMNVVTGDYRSTKLVDGMIHSGFGSDSLERRYSNDFGYYLHLHGSPLFYSNNGYYRKKSLGNLSSRDSFASNHIVLTHFSRKPSVIASSGILSTYWSYLPLVLNEAEEVIIFGYSGLDKHLNRLLNINGRNKDIRVVEWIGSGERSERENFWEKELGRKVELVSMDNILEFDEWE